MAPNGFRAWFPTQRLKDARRLPKLTRNLAWDAAKLLAVVALAETVKRARAGPLGVGVDAPLSVKEGESVFVEALVEAPHALTQCAAYFGGAWQQAASLEPGLRREKWLFRAGAPGLRPVIVRLKDAEGHVVSRTRWVAVLPANASMRRLRPTAPPGRAADAPRAESRMP